MPTKHNPSAVMKVLAFLLFTGAASAAFTECSRAAHAQALPGNDPMAPDAYVISGFIGNQNVTSRSFIAVNPNGTVQSSTDSSGTWVYSSINPNSYYIVNEWDNDQAVVNYTQSGAPIVNAFNSVTQPLVTSSNIGVAYCQTQSTTAGCYISHPGTVLIKSSTILYQWRVIFYLPAASTGANRYTAYVGGCQFTGVSTNALTGPMGGGYIKYSDNLNSGNWVMGAAVNSVQTTSNSAVAAVPGSWNRLVITLNNGTYSYSVNGVSLGTLADGNLLTAVTANQLSANGGIAIVPDGTNFTTARTLMIDRSDFYVTGLSR
jgi:hypothetical protein